MTAVSTLRDDLTFIEEVYHLAGSVTVIREVLKVLKMNVS